MAKLPGKLAMPIRTGLFIKEYLDNNGEGSITDIHQALKAAWKVENENRKQRGLPRIKPATYENFGKYFRHFVKMGYVECVREESFDSGALLSRSPERQLLSIRDGNVVTGGRRIFALTALGQSSLYGWRNPLASAFTPYRK